jgi:hypothetical protein
MPALALARKYESCAGRFPFDFAIDRARLQ